MDQVSLFAQILVALQELFEDALVSLNFLTVHLSSDLAMHLLHRLMLFAILSDLLG